MHYFVVEPEVAGGLGERTVMDRGTHPPVVSHLHYQLEGWLGDAILESFPAFIVTGRAKEALARAGLTGVAFGVVDVTASDGFNGIYPGRQIPSFARLKPSGKAALDDLGLAPDGRLVVSQRTLDVLRQVGITHAVVEPFEAAGLSAPDPAG